MGSPARCRCYFSAIRLVLAPFVSVDFRLLELAAFHGAGIAFNVWEMRDGYLALILHAHLPFVRHPEQADFLEEDWLHEAVAETYLPLLAIFRRMAAEGVGFRLSMTLSPTLCAMLGDGLMRDRTERYLARGVELASLEAERSGADAERRGLAEFYRGRFAEALRFYTRELGRDVVGAFAELQEEGYLEILTCAATHGFLPLLWQQPETVRAQIHIARADYRRWFGRDPLGIWLPECAYVPGLERELREAGLRWFVADAHGIAMGSPRPRFAIFAPYFTPSGPAVFGRDRESSRQVWSAREGYPGDPAYRDFYRDIGQDLPWEQLAPVYGEKEERRFTGIKFHRITGPGPHKEYYRRDWAMGAADWHAGDFLQCRARQIAALKESLPVDPIVVSPYDAELFGHWWFEGPEFLNFFLRKAVYDQDVFRLCTPSEYLRRHPTQQVLTPSASSWGHNGYWEVWLDESNAWIYPHLHAAGERMTAAAKRFAGKRVSALRGRLLRQMARELLLAQSSDWAFLMKTGTAREYAERRTRDHVRRFGRLHEQLDDSAADGSFLRECEERHNLFPELDWRLYA